MSSPRPAAAAAAAAMFILAAAAAFSVTDGAGCESHPPVLARLCSAQSSRPSSSCCGAVFAAADEGGVTCLCSVHDSPFIVVEGFGSRYFISLYMECGGKLPPGSSIDTICVDSELPPETIAHTRSGAISPASTSPETPPPPRDAASPPPPPASSPPPPPSTGRDVPMVSVAPWYSSHLMTAIKIVGGFLCGCALFYCIHLGGPVGSAARALLNAMISLLWFICGRRRRQTPLPADHIGFRQGDNAPQAAVRASPAHAINRTGEGALTTPLDPPHWIPGHRVRPLGESPPTPRLRPSHQTLDQTSGPSSESPPTPRLRPAHQTPNHGGRPPGGARWR